MYRFANAIFFVAGALAVASIANANEFEQIASPFTQALLEDRLHNTVRMGLAKAPFKSVSGIVYGGYKQNAGKGKFKGSFKVYTGHKMSIAKFKLSAGGSVKAMGFSVYYKSKMYAAIKIYPKYVNVAGNYSSKFAGSVSGKKMYGKCKGTVVAWVSKKGIWAKEQGAYTVTIGHKLVYGKYTFLISNGALYFKTYGTYGGEKFFFDYSMSLSLLKMKLQMNPMMITRKYGVVKVYYGKRVITKKFNLEGSQVYDTNTLAALGVM